YEMRRDSDSGTMRSSVASEYLDERDNTDHFRGAGKHPQMQPNCIRYPVNLRPGVGAIDPLAEDFSDRYYLGRGVDSSPQKARSRLRRKSSSVTTALDFHRDKGSLFSKHRLLCQERRDKGVIAPVSQIGFQRLR